MSSPAILWITTIIMAAGGLLILAMGKRRTPTEATNTVLHGIVPLIAACAYFAMAIGQGLIVLPTDAAVVAGAAAPTRIFYYARYIDWTFTTPLLLVSLGLVAMRQGKKHAGPFVGAVLADLMMIITAFAFGASEQFYSKWLWFIISCAAFVGVYFVIWVWQVELNQNERDDTRASYRRFAGMLSILWLLYPVVLFFSPDGANVISDAAAVLAIAVLDVLSKVAYGLLSVQADTKSTDRDLSEGSATLGQQTARSVV